MFHVLPAFALIAKITPEHVEATIFSFAASVINLGIHFGGKYMGLAWNKAIFDVDKDNMGEELWKLNLLEIGLSLLCFAYLPLVPTWAEVRKVQAEFAAASKAEEKTAP